MKNKSLMSDGAIVPLLFVYWASGLWISLGIWARYFPKSWDKTLGKFFEAYY